MDWSKPREARFQTRFFLCGANREILKTWQYYRVGESTSGVFWRFFLLLNSLKKRRCFNTQEFTRFLSTGVVSASSHALWRVLSNNVIWVLGHCWVDIPHIHNSEWDSLFFQSCLLSTITVTPSDPDYVNRNPSLQRFRLIHTSTIRTIASTILRIRTTGCMRTRQSLYEIVGDCSDEGGYRYQTLDRFILREVLACRRR